MHILLVEDDAMLAEAVEGGLRQQGWAVDRAGDVSAARLALLDHGYGAVLLDLGLPRGSGLDVLRAMRGRYDATPVHGLDAGADDYLVKPFPLDELYARLRAVLRRSQGRVSAVLQHEALCLDPARRRVTLDGRDVPLSIHEYRTLLALMERRGWVVTRAQLEDSVYGGDGTIESNTIAVYIHQLRRKLGNELIATVHGFGYRIGEPVA
ncbi:MAG: response regulator transcription factor [Betaproteobacteria bacterium]|nr:MAG: response regulator transcription factor [Betaproteobacteria bacterium]